MTWRIIWLVMVVTWPNWQDASVLGQDLIIVPEQLGREAGLEEQPPGVPRPADADTKPSPEPELSAAAIEILDSYNVQAKEIRRKAEDEIRQRRELLIQKLQSLQDDYTRAAKLDEAVAIRDRLRRLRAAHLNARRDPGNLVTFGTKRGRTFFFEVVGSARGTVWGTDLYTTDSSVATAAVHAGVLKAGQRGIVKVTIEVPPEEFTASASNGVNSRPYGAYPAAYSVERPLPSDEADATSADESTDPIDQQPQDPFAPVLNIFEIRR